MLITDQLRKIKYAYQRATRGYSDEDWWDIGGFLSKIVPKMVRKLKEDGIGHPMTLTEKQWASILEKIAVGFEAYDELLDELPLPSSGRYKTLEKRWKTGSSLFVEWMHSLWD